MYKEVYEVPELEVIDFHSDVIFTSATICVSDTTSNEGEPVCLIDD